MGLASINSLSFTQIFMIASKYPRNYREIACSLTRFLSLSICRTGPYQPTDTLVDPWGIVRGFAEFFNEYNNADLSQIENKMNIKFEQPMVTIGWYFSLQHKIKPWFRRQPVSATYCIRGQGS